MRLFRSDLFNLGLLAVLAGLLYGFQLGAVGLIDPDEPFYSLTAKEMLVRDDASTPVLFGAPQFEKPILFYWVLYACGKLFGMNEASMRLGPCLAGILTVLVTYGWARVLWKRPGTAFVSAAILMTAAEFVVLSRLVLTDIFLCLFTTAAFACFSWGYARPRARTMAWTLTFAAMALGVLTKGPLGVIVPMLGIGAALVASDETSLLARFPWKRGLALFAVIAVPWFAVMTARYGPEFLAHFLVHENVRRFFVAEHRSMSTPLFYPAVLFIGFFPWCGLLPAAIVRAFSRLPAGQAGAGRRAPERLLIACAFIPLVFFTLSESKLSSYILPLFPPLALLAGGWAARAARVMRKTAPHPALIFWLFVSWVAIPAGIAAALWYYGVSKGLAFEGPAVAAAVALAPASAGFFYVLCRRPVAAFTAVLLAVFAFAAMCFAWLLPVADAQLSSRSDASVWRAEAGAAIQGKPPFFLASKILFRGVSYYTETDRLAVFGGNAEKAFYTRPALPLFSKRGDLALIPDGDFPVYAFLRMKDGRLLREFAANGDYSVTTIRSDGQKEIVRLDRVKAAP